MKLSIYGNNIGKPGQVISWSGTSSGSALVDENGSVYADDALIVGGTYTFAVDADRPLTATTFMDALREAAKRKGSPLTGAEREQIHSRCKS